MLGGAAAVGRSAPLPSAAPRRMFARRRCTAASATNPDWEFLRRSVSGARQKMEEFARQQRLQDRLQEAQRAAKQAAQQAADAAQKRAQQVGGFAGRSPITGRICKSGRSGGCSQCVACATLPHLPRLPLCPPPCFACTGGCRVRCEWQGGRGSQDGGRGCAARERCGRGAGEPLADSPPHAQCLCRPEAHHSPGGAAAGAGATGSKCSPQ